MRIKGLTISNFRVYGKHNHIDFPKSNSQPIVIIGGQNGFGKSTFITSLLWCLYGKLISHVDRPFERMIRNSGGYQSFLKKSLNNSSVNKEHYVELTLEDVSLPALNCKEIIIKRSFSKENENLEILIDGVSNDLVESIGYDLFIQEHILPKEVARFFLFDAERITSLAESRGSTERKILGAAYEKVLGVKKYLDVNSQLESMYERTIRKSSSKEDQERLSKIELEIGAIDERLNILRTAIQDNDSSLIHLDQERELKSQEIMSLGFLGDVMDIENLELEQEELKESIQSTTDTLSSHLTIAPFLFSKDLLVQLENQSAQNRQHISESTRNEIINEINDWCSKNKIEEKNKKELIDNVCSTANVTSEEEYSGPSFEKIHSISTKTDWLLNWVSEQHQMLSRKKTRLNNIRKKLKRLNNSGSNEDVLKIRNDISLLDKRKSELIAKSAKCEFEIELKEKELTSLLKQKSEILKIVNVGKRNKVKTELLKTLTQKISLFINEFKNKRKENLELRITKALKEILHKKDLIDNVKIKLVESEMELSLFNYKNELIPKDSLSMGEKQLYAISLLKALIDESGMDFPVVIDSPLQKLDPNHAEILLNNVFPELAEQVFVLPLPGKEFTKAEFSKCKSKINSLHLIEHTDGNSILSTVNSEGFFNIENKEPTTV